MLKPCGFMFQLDFKSEGRTILHLACHEGYIDLVKFLLNEGADTSEADEEGDTPLHYAAFGLVNSCFLPNKLIFRNSIPSYENSVDPDQLASSEAS